MRYAATRGFLAALLAAGCAESGTSPPPDPTGTEITAVTLTAGGPGVITGSGLDRLPATLTLDGVSVTPGTRSATEVRFTVPALRPCETDGRPVALVFGPLQRDQDRLEVPQAMTLAVGESRVLRREDLAGCLQLAAAPGMYVLTVLHPATEGAGEVIPGPVDTLLEVRTWTYGAPAASRAPAPAAASPPAELLSPPAARRTGLGSGLYGANPWQLDRRYPTVQAGDTVPMVAECGPDSARVTTFPMRVVAAEGGVVVGVDLQSPQAPNMVTADAMLLLRRMALRLDSVLRPAAGLVFGGDFEPAHGFGDRYVYLLGDVGSGSMTGPVTREECVTSSEVMMGGFAMPAGYTMSEAAAAWLTYDALHDYGHAADHVVKSRSLGPGGSRYGAQGPFVEAVAEQMPEVAARLLSGQLTELAVAAPAPRIATSWPVSSFHGRYATWTPFGRDERDGRGPYALGGSLLLFARELTGEAQLATPAAAPLYRRLLAGGDWSVTALAGLVGKTPAGLMDEWSLASAVDGYTVPGTTLPTFRSWDAAGPVPTAGSRVTAGRFALATGRGSYAALYFGDQGEDAGRGVSLQVIRVSPLAFTARLTRTR